MARKLLILLVFIDLCHFYCCMSSEHLHLRFHEAYERLTGDTSVQQMTIDELGVSQGTCNYSFIPFVGYEDTRICYSDDKYILHILAVPQAKRPPIFVNCIKKHHLKANITNEFIVADSSDVIVDLLTPIGNNDKPYQPGSCVLVYFYTVSCFGCQIFAVPIVETAYAFKTIHVAAIDAFKFPVFSYKYNIVGLPTIILFHQGHPVVKYRGGGSLIAFVAKHTRLQPQKVPDLVNSHAYNLLGFNDYPSTNYNLLLAWLFILYCLAYYFSFWQLLKKILEQIRRAF